ncbi:MULTISPECIES: aminotransferase class III-fold pyridoxal phosphate-dependent enzyme [unclassified Pseudomonas]|uniref:aminotransferase class III-fold pyridoxal phosphate-dependent enzyme n=1 Tax=unclassified Pseudomonas TaxID=196821 RepID=UPI000D3BED80|nr:MULTISPECIES: aminotransferase class III-fold pyridoxal phosphate-dependent enzyme [unclassified Pseudomonas]RAU46242.1 hypothetical protein DBP26_011935 [Pseudomonas sp. RIT 409]RAU53712.1 hypothetical protein DBY65_012900 [Pseudomonas sp. RIT 412]
MNLFKRLRSVAESPSSVAEPSSLLPPLERLRQRTGSDEAGFFAAEYDAFTGAMKLARLWGERHRRGHCGVLSASGGRFDGLLESLATDFCRVPFNDLAAVEAAVDSRTVAIVLEPIQGETVVTPATHTYVRGMERLCRALNILLILNVARGTPGPLGGLLCEEAYGVRGDIVVVGDHSNRSPRIAALLARDHACMAPMNVLPGYVQQPSSDVRAAYSVAPIRPQRALLPRGLMA